MINVQVLIIISAPASVVSFATATLSLPSGSGSIQLPLLDFQIIATPAVPRGLDVDGIGSLSSTHLIRKLEDGKISWIELDSKL